MKKAIEAVLFGSKWLLVPFYLGLIVAMAIYCGTNMKEIYHLVLDFSHISEEKAMLVILKLVDMTMIANLIKMIITGSYNSFISKSHGHEGENVSSGLLKVKMATSLVGVSSIHMLQKFIDAQSVDVGEIYKLLWIHGGFIVGVLALAWVDYLHCKTERH